MIAVAVGDVALESSVDVVVVAGIVVVLDDVVLE